MSYFQGVAISCWLGAILGVLIVVATRLGQIADTLNKKSEVKDKHE